MQTAKIFANGSSQAVRLPKECRLSGSEVYVKKLGRVIMLFPKKHPWAPLINSLDKFSPDFMADRSQPPVQTRRAF